jgi:hypothetical protein
VNTGLFASEGSRRKPSSPVFPHFPTHRSGRKRASTLRSHPARAIQAGRRRRCVAIRWARRPALGPTVRHRHSAGAPSDGSLRYMSRKRSLPLRVRSPGQRATASLDNIGKGAASGRVRRERSAIPPGSLAAPPRLRSRNRRGLALAQSRGWSFDLTSCSCVQVAAAWRDLVNLRTDTYRFRLWMQVRAFPRIGCSLVV